MILAIPPIATEEAGGIITVTINRESKRNAINAEMRDVLWTPPGHSRFATICGA